MEGVAPIFHLNLNASLYKKNIIFWVTRACRAVPSTGQLCSRSFELAVLYVLRGIAVSRSLTDWRHCCIDGRNLNGLIWWQDRKAQPNNIQGPSSSALLYNARAGANPSRQAARERVPKFIRFISCSTQSFLSDFVACLYSMGVAWVILSLPCFALGSVLLSYSLEIKKRSLSLDLRRHESTTSVLVKSHH